MSLKSRPVLARAAAAVPALLVSTLLLAATGPSPAQDTTAPVTMPGEPFVTQPYLQIGDAAVPGKREQLTLVWHTTDENAAWAVETRAAGEAGAKWTGQKSRPASRQVAVFRIAPHRVWTATLSDLNPGVRTAYRVLKGGVPVFESTLLPRRPAGQPQRIVVFGDCSINSPAQKKIAYQTYLAKPDYVFITGDIVYSRGRISEYRSKYVPIYNAETASPLHPVYRRAGEPRYSPSGF